MPNSSSSSPRPPRRRRAALAFPFGLWLIWAGAVAFTAVWIAWPAVWGAAPLEMVRLVVMSALVGVVGLLILTVIEMRLAPWRFLD